MLFTGVVIYSVSVGGIFALVFGWLAQGPVLAPRNRHDAKLQS